MIILVIVFALTLLIDFFVVDCLLEYEYREHYSQWVADGKPVGYTWSPKEKGGFRSFLGFSRDKLTDSWLFSTPEWIKENRRNIRLLWAHRICIYILFGFLLGMIITAIITGKLYYSFL